MELKEMQIKWETKTLRLKHEEKESETERENEHYMCEKICGSAKRINKLNSLGKYVHTHQ